MSYLAMAHEAMLAFQTVALAVSQEGESQSNAVSAIAEEQAGSDSEVDWWAILTDEEREALKPRPIKRRCPWCKHVKHTALCNELRPKRLMPLGKYKGQPIEELPLDYVYWLGSSTIRLDQETRDEIYERFRVVIERGGTRSYRIEHDESDDDSDG